MAIGDVFEVTAGDPSDLYCIDTGVYDTPEYGAVYVVDAERPAVVDTGIGAHYERVIDGLHEIGIDPADVSVIAPTHVHLDHAGGTGFLADECPDAEVVVHGIGAPHLVDPTQLIEGTKRAVGDQWDDFYVEPKPVPEGRIRELADGDTVDLGDRILDVLHAPGHAPHQVAFHEPDDGVVLAGDAAGIYVRPIDEVVPTTPPPNFDVEQAIADTERLRDLGPDTVCYGHFGAAEAEGRLDRHCEVLRDWADRIEEKYGELGDHDAVVDHFVERPHVERLAEAWNGRRARDHTEINTRGILVSIDRRDR